MALALPETLTPSKLGSFVHCPLAFRYSYIDRLPEPASIHQVRGTLLHRALQLFYSEGKAETRTPERAQACLSEAIEEITDSEEFISLGLDAAEHDRFVADARALIGHYLSLEDPTRVNPVGLELDLRAHVGDIELRGIIDRLDFLDNGEFVVIDYKTGRSPRPELARARFVGVQFYAYLCEQVFGRRPREIRLMYLRDQVVIVETPTDQSMRGLRQRALAVWAAIERACTNGDFRPNPSPLCRGCGFKDRCPAFGGAELS